MTNQTTTAADQLRSVALELIDEVEGHNPRERFDADELAALAKSISEHGVLSPVALEPGEGGRYRLIAGHRRVRAARAAGLAEVPALVRSGADAGTRRVWALTENVMREDLTPLEEARALADIRKGSGLGTQGALAQALGVSPGWVSERTRLLKLPGPVQELIGQGKVPLGLVGRLEHMAKASPSVCEAVAVLVAEAHIEARLVETAPQAAVDRVRRTEWAGDQPLAVPMPLSGHGFYSSLNVEDLPLAEEVRTAYIQAAERPWVRFEVADTDACRALGALLEFPEVPGSHQAAAYVCDAEVLADRVKVQAEAARRRAEERAQREIAAGRPDPRTPDPHAGLSAEEREKAVKAERAKERQGAKDASWAAYRENTATGIALAKAFARPALSLEQARLLARLVLSYLDEAGPDGLRLCAPGWNRIETRTLKDGTVREKVAYLSRPDAKQKALEWVVEPSTPEEVLGRVLQAYLSMLYANQEAVPKSDRGSPGGYFAHGGGPTRALAAAVSKGVVAEPTRERVHAVHRAAEEREAEIRASMARRASVDLDDEDEADEMPDPAEGRGASSEPAEQVEVPGPEDPGEADWPECAECGHPLDPDEAEGEVCETCTPPEGEEAAEAAPAQAQAAEPLEAKIAELVRRVDALDEASLAALPPQIAWRGEAGPGQVALSALNAQQAEWAMQVTAALADPGGEPDAPAQGAPEETVQLALRISGALAPEMLDAVAPDVDWSCAEASLRALGAQELADVVEALSLELDPETLEMVRAQGEAEAA